MSDTRVSFDGCHTKADVLERMGRFLDSHYYAQVRTIAARWSEDDGARCDAASFQSEIAQLRAEFERNRADCLAVVARALDEVCLP